jgi:pseudaminic acid cytidylyltransferase
LNIAIIPARGGSKRIPKKNMRDFHGKPMIAYAISKAKESNLFDDIIVSTDCEEIANCALKYGASVPFIRPAELSNDMAMTIPVLQHAESWLEQNNILPDFLCCMYPTTPLLAVESIEEGYEKIRSNKDRMLCLSVFKANSQFYRAVSITEDGRVKMLWPENYNERSQDLPSVYHDAGQFYWWRSGAFSVINRLFCDESIVVEVPSNVCVDIDEPADWALAESLYKYNKETMLTNY